MLERASHVMDLRSLNVVRKISQGEQLARKKVVVVHFINCAIFIHVSNKNFLRIWQADLPIFIMVSFKVMLIEQILHGEQETEKTTTFSFFQNILLFVKRLP